MRNLTPEKVYDRGISDTLFKISIVFLASLVRERINSYPRVFPSLLFFAVLGTLILHTILMQYARLS